MDPLTSSSTPHEHRPSGTSVRRLWQVPVFFVGLVALVAACLTRGLLGPDPVRQLHHELAETRRLLSESPRDAEGSLRLARSAVEKLAYDPTRAAEAYFLLGSAQLLAAEAAGDAPGEEAWKQARQCLQEAEQRGLAGDDLNRLHYRLAKIAFHVQDNPAQVIELLKANSGAEDDRAEALTLLSQAYLRLNPPDLKKALEANKKLRGEVLRVGEDVLGPAKLAGAKLLLQLNQRDEARKTLELIREQAPPAVLAEKNMLLAGLYQEESKWTEAAALWRAVLDEKRVPLTEAGGVLYNLGVCCRHLEQPSQAAEAWEDCLHRGKGEEAQAAALALAELRLHEPHPDKAVATLGEAVAKIRKADDWKNSLVELPHVRELFEQAISTYREAKRFDRAVQSAELYERVAAPPKAQVYRADLNSEWASIQREQARGLRDAAARKKAETTADELLRQAAQAHSEAAKLISDKKDRTEHEWLSAVSSFEGRDYRVAADKLSKIVAEKKDDPDRESEGWYLLGETCGRLNDNKAACEAYHKCIEKDARFTCRARYQLAMIEIDNGHIDDAVKELEQNLSIIYPDADPEVREKSLFALCSLLYQSGQSLPQNYRRVVHHLEGSIDHFAVTPEAVRARFQLADSYCRFLAQERYNQHSVIEKSSEGFAHYLDVCRRNWKRAAEEFTKLEQAIKDPEQASLLSLKQQADIPFRIADCYFNLGEYENALHKYEEVATKWGKHRYALRALGETIKCYAGMEDFTRLHQRAEKIRGMLATAEGLTEADRQQWIEWLNTVNKAPQNNPGRATPRDEQPRIIINGHRDEPRITPDHGPLLGPQR